MGGGGFVGGSKMGKAYRVLDSCSLSKVPWLFNSSMRETVTSFSLGFDSAVVMGRVTPRYLGGIARVSAPDESDAGSVSPSRFVVLESHGFGVCRGISG